MTTRSTTASFTKKSSPKETSTYGFESDDMTPEFFKVSKKPKNNKTRQKKHNNRKLKEERDYR